MRPADYIFIGGCLFAWYLTKQCTGHWLPIGKPYLSERGVRIIKYGKNSYGLEEYIYDDDWFWFDLEERYTSMEEAEKAKKLLVRKRRRGNVV